MQLTPGCLSEMVRENHNPGFHPRVQILKINKIPSPTTPRYRIILSDGEVKAQGMFATQNNEHLENGVVTENSVIEIGDYMINNVKDKALIIILSFDETTVKNPGMVIGQPKAWTNSMKEILASNSNSPSSVARGNNAGNAYVKPESNRSNHSNPYGGGGGGASSYNRNATAPIMRSNTSTKPITPIASLNMYQNRWTIKARVTNKSDIRHWSNAKGEGQLFSIELLDSSMDIRATFFKEAVDKFYPMLEMDKVYTFSGGRMKTANMQYNTCKSPFELTFDQNSEIALEDDTGEILQQSYDLIQIADLESVEPGKHVDVIGVVKMVGEPGSIVSKKTGKELQKCELTVGDDSGAEVSCTVWGERAMGAPTEFAGFPVVAFRRARVSDFGGRTLSASGGNGINIHPRIPEAQRIQNWWQQGGGNGAVVKKLSSSGGGASRFPDFKDRKCVAAIKNENLGHDDKKPDYVSFKATVSFIKSDKDGGAWYPACANAGEPCKNRYKVTQGTDGNWFCERCQKTYENCMYRYIFPATLCDGTSTTWVSFFDDQANVLLDGMSADELQRILADPDQGGQEAYDGIFARAKDTEWIFTCKVKQETHQEELRIKTSVQSIHPMDYAKEGRYLLNDILAM